MKLPLFRAIRAPSVVLWPGQFQRRNPAGGFTLVEMIIVMVITGILAGMVAYFIRVPVQSYVDAVARADLSDVADTSMRRLTRDLRLALPNSVRVFEDGSGHGIYLELLLTKTGGRYLAEEDEAPSGNILSFSDVSALSFDLVGTPPSGRQAIVPGDAIVVYNLGPGFDPTDAYNCTGGSPSCNRATVANVAGNTITLQSNPFASQNPSMPSPTNRFQVVTTPVTYFCDQSKNGGTGRLVRYSGYAIAATQPVDSTSAPLSTAPVQARLADQIVECVFTVDLLTNAQRGLVTLKLTLGSGNETLSLQQQIHVDNAP